MVEGYFRPTFVPEGLSCLWFISLCCFFSPTYGIIVKKWSYKVWQKMTFFSDWGLNRSRCAQTWWRMNEPNLLKLTRHVVSSYWAFVGFFFLIGEKLLCNVVLVSAVQHESVIIIYMYIYYTCVYYVCICMYISTPSWISFPSAHPPFRLSQDTRVGSLGYTAASHSVQFSCSVVSGSLRPHGLQHARLPCPSLSDVISLTILQICYS